MYIPHLLFTLYTKPNVVASIFKKQYNINKVIVNDKKNRGLKHGVTFSNAIEKNYMIHLKVIQKTKIPMSKMLDKAIEDYLKKHEIKY